MSGWSRFPSPEKRVARDLMIIVTLAAFVRVVLLFAFDYQKDLHGGDSSYYLEVGRNIFEYGVHGTQLVASFSRPPLYSLFAGFVGNVFENAALFYVVQSTLFTFFAVAVYFLLRTYGSRLAFWSALLIAASPFDALMNGRVLAENLTTPLLVLATLLFIRSPNSSAILFGSGTLLGAAVLSRDVYLLLPLVFLATGLWTKMRWRHLGYFVLGFILLTAPWIYRNSQLPSGGIFLSKGTFWTNVFIGTWERDPGWTSTPDILPPEAWLTIDHEVPPAVVLGAWIKKDQSFFKKTSIQYMRGHPVEVVRTWVIRYPRLWFGTRSDLNSPRMARHSAAWYLVKVTFYALNAALIVLGFLGMVLSVRSAKLPVPLCLPVLYTAVIYLPFHSTEARYSQPVIPLLIIFAVSLALFSIEKWPRAFMRISPRLFR